MDARSDPSAWRLISVLFSTVPLSPPLATTLCQAALDLLRTGAGVAPIDGDVVMGRVVNLRKDLLLGAIGGPAFEAELETERGAGKVRFLVTRDAVEAGGAERPPPRRELLN